MCSVEDGCVARCAVLMMGGWLGVVLMMCGWLGVQC